MQRAIRLVGGVRQLGNEIGVSAQTVSNWRLRESVPIEFCVPIETVTGAAARRRMEEKPQSALKQRIPARALCSDEQFDKHVAFVGHFFDLTPKPQAVQEN